MARFGLLLAVVSLCGCTTLSTNKTVCAEYRDLICATAPECSMDRARGCQVCQCRPPAYFGPPANFGREGGGLPSGIPPDRR